MSEGESLKKNRVKSPSACNAGMEFIGAITVLCGVRRHILSSVV